MFYFNDLVGGCKMKQWGDEDAQATILDHIERVTFGALIAASVLVVLASLFRWVAPNAL